MKALAMGAVLWDIVEGVEYIGGAPLNLSAHLTNLGWETALLSSVGKDDRGRRAVAAIKELGIRADYVYEQEALPTGIAMVTLDENRIPAYDLPHSAYDEIPWNDRTFEDIKAFAPDVLYIGTHDQRCENNQRLWRKLCKNVPAKYVYYDVNMRQDFHPKEVIEGMLSCTDILKLSDEEASTLCEVFWGRRGTPREFGDRISREYPLYCIAITLGPDGCLIWHDGEVTHVPGNKVQAVNTVGCGDAFSAGFLTTLLKTGDPVKAAEKGNLLGAYVASTEDSIPKYPASFLD